MEPHEGVVMHIKSSRSIRDRLVSAYWVIVGIFGIGGPIVDRQAMYGDDPRNDPYDIRFDPSGHRERARPASR